MAIRSDEAGSRVNIDDFLRRLRSVAPVMIEQDPKADGGSTFGKHHIKVSTSDATVEIEIDTNNGRFLGGSVTEKGKTVFHDRTFLVDGTSFAEIDRMMVEGALNGTRAAKRMLTLFCSKEQPQADAGDADARATLVATVQAVA